MISCTLSETTSPRVLSVTPINSVSVIFNSQKLLTFAQAEPEAVEATLGNVVAALLVMAAMAGSLFMITVWWQRYLAGNAILPLAIRKPLRVPLPLLIGGIVLAGMMALTILLAAIIPEDMLNEPVDGEAAVVDVEQPVEVATDTLDGVTEANGDDLAADKSDNVADGDEITKKAGLQEKFHAMLWQTLSINGVMFCIFGAFTYLSQINQNRRSLTSADVSYPPFGTVHATWNQPIDDTDVDGVNSTNHFLDNADSVETQTNPYAVANPYAEDHLEAIEASQPNPEPWCFAAELRFACETFLVAYLPTSVLRLLIVKILPDAPSHPFLEMLADGVDLSIMALIALMAVVVAPLVEELLYRVTVLGGLWQQHNLVAAWVASSVLFSFAHGFPDSIALLPLAFAIGYTYIRRRSYRTVVLVHFLFNGFNMAIAGASML